MFLVNVSMFFLLLIISFIFIFFVMNFNDIGFCFYVGICRILWCLFMFFVLIFWVEEMVFLDFFSFMYSNILLTITFIVLLDVLMVVDKFEVVFCMSYCSRLLRNLFMICEFVLLYLDFLFSVLMVDVV